MIHADGTGNVLTDMEGARVRVRIHMSWADFDPRWHWTIYKPAGELIIASMVPFDRRTDAIDDLCDLTGFDPSLFDLPSYA